ncbi:hypothetical protein ACCO45_000902 [Purpureocillium lilacinum]|uniref:Uncharacterized protein n=1 Tax=Purpureocillium lilacinum TaxID=33203 RepID=A0ACC4E6E0_PURLI
MHSQVPGAVLARRPVPPPGYPTGVTQPSGQPIVTDLRAPPPPTATGRTHHERAADQHMGSTEPWATGNQSPVAHQSRTDRGRAPAALWALAPSAAPSSWVSSVVGATRRAGAALAPVTPVCRPASLQVVGERMDFVRQAEQGGEGKAASGRSLSHQDKISNTSRRDA